MNSNNAYSKITRAKGGEGEIDKLLGEKSKRKYRGD